MTKDGLLEVALTLGGSLAMQENIGKLTIDVLAEAERLALARAKEDGYEAAILRRDIEQALESA